MCLILLAWKTDPERPLVVAANRDEFYARPSAPARFWEDAPEILAGRDLQNLGTWLGVTRGGRFAALTNYRDPSSLRSDAPSRGILVSDYLRGRESPEAYLRRVAAGANDYNGFNLLVGDRQELFGFSNRGRVERLRPGIHGLSNHLLDTPWPKVANGKSALAGLLERERRADPEALLAILADRSNPPDAALPDTGVGLALERVLSPLFIESPGYGTRSSTVLLTERDGKVTFVERLFNGIADSRITVRFHFRISRPERSG